jgi:hypothetical protein
VKSMNLKALHPRLIVSESTWRELRAKGIKSPTFGRLLKKIECEGRSLLGDPPLGYRRTRLLDDSRGAIQRILLWAFNYHLTGDEEFKARAEQDMLTVSAFADWNLAHFLYAAEMTTALAIGYDWLYDVLPPASRAIIRQAIVEKGLKPGSDPNPNQAATGEYNYNWWQACEYNWNQVCWGGLALGALAVAEDEPQIAKEILTKVRTYNPHGMKIYAPDGLYAEGPGYWGYGTTYQVILLAALESALGTDWNLSQSPGFFATADFPLEVTGPTRLFFNYSDGTQAGQIEPALFWFAGKLHKPNILFFQHEFLAQYLDDNTPLTSHNAGGRFLPLLAVWAADNLEDRTPLKRPLAWHGEGINPLVVFRSSWSDPDALFIALKGGSASAGHGHMDAGSFVLDADRVRWALDLDMQPYHLIELKGVNLWDFAQDGARWSVFRYNNFTHNTLTINGQLHRVKGRAGIIRFFGDTEDFHTVVDLSEVFSGQADKVLRGFKMLPDRKVLIQDELSGLKPDDLVRWTFVTRAEVAVDGRHALLKQDGKTLRITLASPGNGAFEVIPCDPPDDGFNDPNPGVSTLRAHLRAPESGQLVIQVLIQAGEKPVSDQMFTTTPCESWSGLLAAPADNGIQ